MGVMAFCALAIMGLIPTGLTTATRSASTTTSARLAAEVQSEIQQVGLASFSTNTTWFDVDGKILPNSTGAIYDVYRSVQNCNLSGSSTTTLKRVVVQVVKNPGRQVLSLGTNGLYTAPAGLEERTFQFHVQGP